MRRNVTRKRGVIGESKKKRNLVTHTHTSKQLSPEITCLLVYEIKSNSKIPIEALGTNKLQFSPLLLKNHLIFITPFSIISQFDSRYLKYLNYISQINSYA